MSFAIFCSSGKTTIWVFLYIRNAFAFKYVLCYFHFFILIDSNISVLSFSINFKSNKLLTSPIHGNPVNFNIFSNECSFTKLGALVVHQFLYSSSGNGSAEALFKFIFNPGLILS